VFEVVINVFEKLLGVCLHLTRGAMCVILETTHRVVWSSNKGEASDLLQGQVHRWRPVSRTG
jgi:hypothetical protein